MSALVCGKRSSSVFEELLHTPPPASKRVRCSAGASSPTASLLSPPRPSASGSQAFDRSDDDNNNDSLLSGNFNSVHLAHLRSLFPDMDPQFLERALEASGNDLDSAIKSLNDLHLESADINLDSVVSKPENGSETNVHISTEGIMNNSGPDGDAENVHGAESFPTCGSEWVELFVREMMNATDMDDARARTSRVLEVLEKSIVSRAGAEAMQRFHKENMMLKEQVEVLLGENAILKRAVAIQHECQKEYDERSQELQHLKQLVSQYQEQLRTLESGGPTWEVEVGRKDSLTAGRSIANATIPAPTSDVATLVQKFRNLGLSPKDMVALSGAHTIGKARCSSFNSRLGGGNSGNVDLEFLQSLQQLCSESNGTLAHLDLATPATFDNQYYINLLSGEGLLPSDQVLLNGAGEVGSLVQAYAMDPLLFFEDFKASMLRMGRLAPPAGSGGEVRTSCRAIN
ncbi:hypothetical protein COCNU_01G010680 [Cocos nucifera]|uniref:Peroxidase n=1 Tax=Cocos nucifera TaxID=13894 RepID=A0A8K0HV88_COCNU|nr:hypothetical protein COCNU_01G010680 [Cocos nucifera]